MKQLVQFSLRRRVTVSMVAVVLVIFGFISFDNLGLDMLPDIESPFVSIVTNYSGVSSEDIEQNVTRPLEQWVSTVSRVKELKSISLEGISIIMVEFEGGTNLDFAAQDIREKIGLLENFLPEGAKKPLVVKFDFEDMPIMMYGVTGGNRPLNDLKDLVEKEVAARLERLDGVASAQVFSPEESEVLIDVDKGKLEARGLSITSVEQAVMASNINQPSGHLDRNYNEFLLRTIGEFEKVKEIESVVVGLGRTGEPVFLRDIATVSEAHKEVRRLVRINGQKGMLLMVTKSSGANTVLVARAVKKTLKEIQPYLDKDLRFSRALDFSRVIEIMAANSARNVIVGGFLAMLLILFFLRNLKPTLTIGVAIPLSVVTTFIALDQVGYTLNLITMGGIALGVGMMVDNAIVVIESIFRHLEEGKSPEDSALMGTSEVGTAIVASTLTTIAVFFPMMFATGMAGTMSRGLAVSVAFALLSSLVVALTIIPVLAARFFRGATSGGKVSGGKAAGGRTDITAFSKTRDFYKKWLKRALRHRKTVLVSVLLLFIASLLVTFFLGAEFLPDADQALLFLKLRMPVGTSLAETDRVIKHLETQSIKNPHVISTMVSVGMSEQNPQDSASGFNPEGSYEATLWAYLVTKSKRTEDISDKEILEQWRLNFPLLQKGKVAFVDLASMSMGMSSASPIEFNIYGRELGRLKQLAEQVKNTILPVEGIRDVEISLEETKPEIKIKIKKEEASRLGLTPLDISHQVRTFTIGTVVSRIMLEGEERDIRVRLNKKDRATLEDLKKLPVVSPTGARVYLSQVADFVYSLGAVKIYRENQVRRVTVSANYVDRDLGGIVDEIVERTQAITRNLPEGYFYQMGGRYKDMLEAFVTMGLAMLLAVVLVYAVMASQFESLKYPFIIMFTIPLAFIGVTVLLAITGKNVSLPAVMGFIMLGGIVVNNGIVMVDYINQLIARGEDKLEAVIEGAVVRLRPILITALSTIFGMLPMAIATSEGSEVRSPMAIALIGGLLASTFLTLFIVPILYTYFSKIKTGGK